MYTLSDISLSETISCVYYFLCRFPLFFMPLRIEHKKVAQDLPGTSKVGEESHDGFRIGSILLTGVITVVRLLLLLL